MKVKESIYKKKKKHFLGINRMKCPDFHRKVMFAYPPCLLGVRVVD